MDMNPLKLWRMERNLTQVELSHISRVPRHVIQMAETDLIVPSVEYQYDLASSLGVSITELFPVKKRSSLAEIEQDPGMGEL